jgi:hypothetical protein
MVRDEGTNKTITFRPGDAALTRLVRKLAGERGLAFESQERWNGYGYEVYQYEVDEAVYREAVATVESRRAAKRDKEEARIRRQEEARRRAWQEELARRFPRLKAPIQFGSDVYDRAEDIPIDKMTRTDWRGLGYRVTAVQPQSYLVTGGGIRVVPLYGPWHVEEIPSRRRNWAAERLWGEYQARGLSEAHAVWAANRLAKLFPKYRRTFYGIKDRFLRAHQHHLVEGRFVRTETSECWSCDGDDWCDRCGGTGVYRQRDLYEHVLEFEGKVYSFHTYVRPARLGESKGADLPAYGRRLTSKDTIPYRIGEYIRMLSHLAESWE